MDESKMQASVLEAIPLGTPMDAARRSLEANGFSCELMPKSQWRDRKGIDFLYGRKVEKAKDSLWQTGYAQVALILTSNVVQEVLIRVSSQSLP